MRRAILATALAACLGAPALAQAPGAYSPAQAQRGDKLFAAQCALCHAKDLTGAPGAPPLRGSEFAFKWDGKTVGELYGYIRTSMPPTQPGSLSDQQYTDLTALILSANKQPSGAADLAPDGAGMKTSLTIQ